MHIVLKHLQRLIFLFIIANSFLPNVIYSQNITYTKQDSILIKYFNTWTGKKIQYYKSDTIKNILDFNLGTLYDTVWVKRDDLSSETVDSSGIIETVEISEENLYYRRIVAFQQLNQFLYIGFATNILKDNLKKEDETEFYAMFFVFNINKKKLYMFINLGFNTVINDKLQIKNVINDTRLCEVYNKYYNCVEIITFNNREQYLDGYAYFKGKSKYIIYEKFITIFNKKIKISENKKKQKMYLNNYTDIARLKEYLDFIIKDL